MGVPLNNCVTITRVFVCVFADTDISSLYSLNSEGGELYDYDEEDEDVPKY